jgi:hypothetical protein
VIGDRQIDHERRRVTVVLGATLEADEVRQLITKQAEMGIWHYDVLCDERAMTTVLSGDAVRNLVAHVESLSRKYGAHGRMAIVPGDDPQYGMARMYSLLAENAHVDCRVFRTIASAEAWLDQQPIES